MDIKDSSTAIKEENQPALLLGGSDIKENPDIESLNENLSIKSETSLIIEDVETESGTLKDISSVPFTLKEKFDLVNENNKLALNSHSPSVVQIESSFDELHFIDKVKPDENVEKIHIIDSTSNKEMSLNRHLPNDDQIKSIVEIPPIKNDEKNSKSGEDCVKMSLNTKETKSQIVKNTDCIPPHIQQDNPNTPVRSSNRKKRSRSKGITDDFDYTIVSYKKNKKDSSISPESNSPTKDSSTEISILEDGSNINKKIKCSESKKNNCCMKTNLKIKPCSIVIERTIASHKNVIDNGKVCQKLNMPLSDTSSKKAIKSKINSESKHPTLERSLQLVDSTSSKETLSTRSVQNVFKDSTIPISLDTVKKLTKTNPNITSPDKQLRSTKELINKRFSKLVTQNRSGLQQSVKHPKQTYEKAQKSLPESIISHVIPSAICKKKVDSKPQKVLSPTQNNETRITDKPIPQENPKESISQIVDRIKGKKALSIQPVNSNKLLKPGLITNPLPTNPKSQNTLKQKVPIHSNWANISHTMFSPSKMHSEEQIKKSEMQHKEIPNLEELLDRAPPFIQEVFKCDNIRDGFINEDLIFVLSLLPDMEEMADNEKLQFQLRVIELITDVLTDPVLKT